ncbi:MAG: methionine adenosyltransferase [Clostridiales bacterium]|jgi:S-adenosylmethionine synthetase|nr:methionine adenosyltransferase [Clostridiales bacterium]
MRKIFTSESVTRGHPDKMCDQISDAILDAILAQDANARVACEVLASTGLVFVAGEITTECYVDIESVVRETVRDIGYTRAKFGFDCDSCAVILSVKGQSPDIARGVDASLESRLSGDFGDLGAGDQGMMFGFACNETPSFMPLPVHLAHSLARGLDEARKSGQIAYLRPDGKAQISLEYGEDGRPKRVEALVLSAQHAPDVDQATIEHDLRHKIVGEIIPKELIDKDTKFYINPTGRFVIGGPKGDVGLTGRKIIVDSYGGFARHGGGAFSGKDPTKVDRSAAYAARHVAKNIVAAGLANICELQISYAIGVARPLSLAVNTFGTGKISDQEILSLIEKHFDLRPAAIIQNLDLCRPIYTPTAAYGHFGRDDLNLPWERLDMVDILRKG